MEKLIHVRQAVAYAILSVLFVISAIAEVPKDLFMVIASYYVVLSGIIFIPVMRRELKYSNTIQSWLYYVPMFIWIITLVIRERTVCFKNFEIVSVMILLGIGLFASRFKKIKIVINSPINKIPLEKKRFWEMFFEQLLALLSEEIYFTYFLISMLVDRGDVLAILISSFLFCLSHYLNRWAKSMFKVSDYIYIFVLGVIKAFSFWYSGMLIIPIIIHLIYNSSDFYVLFMRMKAKETYVEKSFFDDY